MSVISEVVRNLYIRLEDKEKAGNMIDGIDTPLINQDEDTNALQRVYRLEALDKFFTTEYEQLRRHY